MGNQETAVDVWSRNIRQIREDARDKRDALYELWLATNMDCWERDRRMTTINASEDASVAFEKDSIILIERGKVRHDPHGHDNAIRDRHIRQHGLATRGVVVNRYALRDSVTGAGIGPGYATKELAVRSAQRRSYGRDNGLAVWWRDDTGKPRVELAYVWNGVIKHHSSVT